MTFSFSSLNAVNFLLKLKKIHAYLPVLQLVHFSEHEHSPCESRLQVIVTYNILYTCTVHNILILNHRIIHSVHGSAVLSGYQLA